MELIELLDMALRWSHILAGVVALLVAPVAMAVRKGRGAHARWGKVYYWGMAWIFVSTVGLTLLRPNLFLLGVGVLSFYSAFTAVRVLRMKRPELDRPALIDWAGALLAVAAGVALLGWGAAMLFGVATTAVPDDGRLAFAGLGAFFGFTVLQSGVADLRRFRRPPTDRQYWWYHHMGNMLGSYIGAVTAFMVQSVSRWMFDVEALAPYAWLVWVLPTAIGVPLAQIWIGRYRRRFAVEPRAQGPVSESAG